MKRSNGISLIGYSHTISSFPFTINTIFHISIDVKEEN